MSKASIYFYCIKLRFQYDFIYILLLWKNTLDSFFAILTILNKKITISYNKKFNLICVEKLLLFKGIILKYYHSYFENKLNETIKIYDKNNKMPAKKLKITLMKRFYQWLRIFLLKIKECIFNIFIIEIL